MAEELRRLRIERTRQLEKEGRKAIGFYREGGKTRPITKPKKKRQKIVKKVVKKAKPASAKTPEDFGWQEHGEGMWKKGHHRFLVGVTGDSEVVWVNDKEETDLVVLDFFDDYDEAVEWAKKWITENPDGLPEDAETEPEVIGTSGGVDIIGERRVLKAKTPEAKKVVPDSLDFDQQIKDHLEKAYQTYLSDCEYHGYNPVSYEEFKQKRGLVWGRHRKKKPEDFGWKQDGLLWTKGEQYLEVAFSNETGSFEVLWGNDDTGDLDVLASVDDQVEAIKYAEKWITVKEYR